MSFVSLSVGDDRLIDAALFKFEWISIIIILWKDSMPLSSCAWDVCSSPSRLDHGGKSLRAFSSRTCGRNRRRVLDGLDDWYLNAFENPSIAFEYLHSLSRFSGWSYLAWMRLALMISAYLYILPSHRFWRIYCSASRQIFFFREYCAVLCYERKFCEYTDFHCVIWENYKPEKSTVNLVVLHRELIKLQTISLVYGANACMSRSCSA